jgi:membrane-bound metal-dependent hydrolase YbcI (DUF457 family)
MDTITHGIAGALIGKALFRGDDLVSKRALSAARLVTWATMLGAIFPDSDVFAALFPHSDMLMISWHRSLTHSLLCLPAFALGLALLTQWFAGRRNWACPSLGMLTLAYAVGIASHIGLDYLNSFGIMLWSPLDWSRPAGDLLFILDFTLSAILLLPHALAWIYEREEGSVGRALRSWLGCVLAVLVITSVSQRLYVRVTTVTALMVAVFLAVLIYGPMLRGRGLRISRAAWCRAGLVVLAAYLGGAVVAHRAALARVKQFVALEKLEVQSLAAMPYPPSLWHWDGMVRTPRGVYVLRMDLDQPEPGGAEGAGALEYSYYPDAPDSPLIEEARALPEIRKLMAFMRFPVTRLHKEGNVSVVDFLDLRFHSAVPGRPVPFTYRVRLDAGGQVVAKGWLTR